MRRLCAQHNLLTNQLALEVETMSKPTGTPKRMSRRQAQKKREKEDEKIGEEEEITFEPCVFDEVLPIGFTKKLSTAAMKKLFENRDNQQHANRRKAARKNEAVFGHDQKVGELCNRSDPAELIQMNMVVEALNTRPIMRRTVDNLKTQLKNQSKLLSFKTSNVHKTKYNTFKFTFHFSFFKHLNRQYHDIDVSHASNSLFIFHFSST